MFHDIMIKRMYECGNVKMGGQCRHVHHTSYIFIDTHQLSHLNHVMMLISLHVVCHDIIIILITLIRLLLIIMDEKLLIGWCPIVVQNIYERYHTSACHVMSCQVRIHVMSCDVM